jgi:hypothetical protein
VLALVVAQVATIYVEAVRPQLVRFKTFEEAAFAVDDIITAVISQSAGSF